MFSLWCSVVAWLLQKSKDLFCMYFQRFCCFCLPYENIISLHTMPLWAELCFQKMMIGFLFVGTVLLVYSVSCIETGTGRKCKVGYTLMRSMRGNTNMCKILYFINESAPYTLYSSSFQSKYQQKKNTQWTGLNMSSYMCTINK